ncbi:hypothetical protein Ddc_10195 [Ditylenchus destructor]|nr:hypothetical protein Ddc_10195 [Ditylenchus destructor]
MASIDSQASKLSLKRRICFKTKNNLNKLVSAELSDSDVSENSDDINVRFQKMDLLALKLGSQQKICAVGVILSVALYFFIWSWQMQFGKCWALPFRDSPCKRARDLPLILTNQSTLAEAVDEFTLALRAQFAKFRDGIEIFHYADRQALSNATKNEIRQLFSHHSADLIAFGAVKREDARIREMLEAMSNGLVIVIFLFIGMMCMGCNIAVLKFHKSQTGTQYKEMPFMEENENTQDAQLEQLKRQILAQYNAAFVRHANTRLKQRKRQILVQYIATFVCIAVGVTLFFTFSIGHYYSGSSPVFMKHICNMSGIKNGSEENCPFTDYRNFSTKLEPILNRHFGKLDILMASPVLEAREMAWMYETEVLEAAIGDHLELKQYHVDRRTMPRKIPKKIPPKQMRISVEKVKFRPVTSGVLLLPAFLRHSLLCLPPTLQLRREQMLTSQMPSIEWHLLAANIYGYLKGMCSEAIVSLCVSMPTGCLPQESLFLTLQYYFLRVLDHSKRFA